MHYIRDWSDCPMVKSTCCPCRVPGFSSQHPHGCSQLPVTLIPEKQMPSSGLYGLLHTYGTHKLMGAHTHTHKDKYNFKCVLLVYNHLKIFVKVYFLCQILGFWVIFKIYFCYFNYLPVSECTWVWAPNVARGFRAPIAGIIYDCWAMRCACWEPKSDPLNKLCMYFTIAPSPVLALDDICKLPSFADTVFQCITGAWAVLDPLFQKGACLSGPYFARGIETKKVVTRPLSASPSGALIPQPELLTSVFLSNKEGWRLLCAWPGHSLLASSLN